MAWLTARRAKNRLTGLVPRFLRAVARSLSHCKHSQAAAAAHKFALRRMAAEKINDLVLMGRSIGSGPAVRLAEHLCEKQGADDSPRLVALVTVSAYTSIRAMTKLLAPGIGAMTLERWNSLKSIQQVTVPALFLHGSDDELIPCAHSTQLANACPGPSATHIIYRGLVVFSEIFYTSQLTLLSTALTMTVWRKFPSLWLAFCRLWVKMTIVMIVTMMTIMTRTVKSTC